MSKKVRNKQNRLQAPPTRTDADNQAWLSMWRRDQIAFHKTSTNEFLRKHWPPVAEPVQRVLVPLCGKSVDMLWLRAQGFEVVGIELSEVAIKAFFEDNSIPYQRQIMAGFDCWQGGGFTLFRGDFFEMTSALLGRVDLVYDCASLTALGVSIRPLYVRHMRRILPDGQCPMYVLTVEDLQERDTQGTIDAELAELYSRYFEIRVMDSDRQKTTRPYPQPVLVTDTKFYELMPKA
ncbi:hypothetical protein [Parathalassolituus penaei]|uniref:thiopurine S-methyltransferase n=1 Tax=Parathalassolituus penaei TaxID=2997323 RepID=A0A9X3EDH7_9GAMM|nr:hypothetical protein [Parathalassolituus penaei]MCY0964705.1 hypothetical protein [Parathalassolituus penaei]